MKKRSAGILAGVIAALAGAGVWYRARVSGPPSGCNEEAIRARVVAIAMSHVGKREMAAYLSDAAPMYTTQDPPEWCGIFALYVFHQAGLGKGVQWKVGLGFVEPQRFPRVSNPKPGDVAYFAAPWQHHAIVRDVRGDTVDLINGNGTGNLVSLSSPPLAKATTYYSLQKWIDQAIAEGCK